MAHIAEVEEVLGHAVFDDEQGQTAMHWLIKWKGFDEEQSTWEPLRNVKHNRMWKQYEMKRTKKRKRSKQLKHGSARKPLRIRNNNRIKLSPQKRNSFDTMTTNQPTKKRKTIAEVIDLISDSEQSCDEENEQRVNKTQDVQHASLCSTEHKTEEEEESKDIETIFIPLPPPQFVYNQAIAREKGRNEIDTDLMIDTPLTTLKYPRFRVFGCDAVIAMSYKELIQVRDDKIEANDTDKCWLDPELG